MLVDSTNKVSHNRWSMGGERCDRQMGEERCDRQMGGERCDRQMGGERCDRQMGGERCDRQMGGERCERLLITECKSVSKQQTHRERYKRRGEGMK